MSGLNEARKKVAFVGDGINDVEAFRFCSVPFAMGDGTSFARNNAAMVMTGNDFEAVIRAVMWGRNIYANVKRFLQF